MSKEKFLTGIDAGTFVGRCSIFDIEGREKSNSYKEWSYT